MTKISLLAYLSFNFKLTLIFISLCFSQKRYILLGWRIKISAFLKIRFFLLQCSLKVIFRDTNGFFCKNKQTRKSTYFCIISQVKKQVSDTKVNKNVLCFSESLAAPTISSPDLWLHWREQPDWSFLYRVQCSSHKTPVLWWWHKSSLSWS